MSPGAGRAECSFLCLFLLFLFSGGLGRRRSGSPIRISNAHISATPSRGSLGLCAKNITARKPAAYHFYGMYLHTPLTTTCIGLNFQGLSAAPITGSLPRSLWSNHVVKFVRSCRPVECTVHLYVNCMYVLYMVFAFLLCNYGSDRA